MYFSVLRAFLFEIRRFGQKTLIVGEVELGASRCLQSGCLFLMSLRVPVFVSWSCCCCCRQKRLPAVEEEEEEACLTTTTTTTTTASFSLFHFCLYVFSVLLYFLFRILTVCSTATVLTDDGATQHNTRRQGDHAPSPSPVASLDRS